MLYHVLLRFSPSSFNYSSLRIILLYSTAAALIGVSLPFYLTIYLSLPFRMFVCLPFPVVAIFTIIYCSSPLFLFLPTHISHLCYSSSLLFIILPYSLLFPHYFTSLYSLLFISLYFSLLPSSILYPLLFSSPHSSSISSPPFPSPLSCALQTVRCTSWSTQRGVPCARCSMLRTLRTLSYILLPLFFFPAFCSYFEFF